MVKKTTITIALSSLFVASGSSAVTLYEDDAGDFLKLYGEVGVGGHVGANIEYGEFNDDKFYIDDSFATMGVRGKNDHLHFRLEIDYERENFVGGSGDMVTTIDKVFVGYEFNEYNYIEAGLTDTAFDDYDWWGDFTFDTTVETGEAGDQDNTVKYEGNYAGFKVGVSYSYDGESSSGALQGDIVNGYFGYFGDSFSIVAGLEGRAGSDGESKFGRQRLAGLGARVSITDNLTIGLNAFIEEEDISRESFTRTLPQPGEDDDAEEKVFINYQTERNEGGLISVKYELTPQWEFVGSANYEAYEIWDDESELWQGETSWGKDRTWGTLGVNYKPTRSSVLAVEGNFGDSAQDAYVYAVVFF